MSSVKVYELRLKFTEPVSVVSDAEGSKLYVLRSPTVSWDGKGATVHYAPVIPASTLKGTLRSLALSIAKSVYDCDVVKLHEENVEPRERPKSVPHHRSDESWQELLRNETVSGRVKELLKYLREEGVSEGYFEEMPDGEKWERVASLSCPVCLLFGSQYSAGLVRVSDVVLHGYENVLNRVVIDRGSGKVKEGKLFSMETIEGAEGKAYLVFAIPKPLEDLISKVGLECNGKSPLELAEELWNQMVEILKEDGLELGHSKGVGMGRAEVEIREVEEV